MSTELVTTPQPPAPVDPALKAAVTAFWKNERETETAIGFAVKLCGSKDHASEMFDAAVASVLGGSPPWNGTSKIVVLVCGVIRRIHIDERRSAAVRRRDDDADADGIPVSSANPERMRMKEQRRVRLAIIADELRAKFAADPYASKVFASIVDDDIGDETLAEQAERLGIPKRSWGKLENARRRVAYEIQKYAAEELAP